MRFPVGAPSSSRKIDDAFPTGKVILSFYSRERCRDDFLCSNAPFPYTEKPPSLQIKFPAKGLPWLAGDRDAADVHPAARHQLLPGI